MTLQATYPALLDALKDGWVVARHVDIARDVSEPPGFIGYSFELGYTGICSTTIRLTEARNKGGATGAYVEMFRAEDVEREGGFPSARDARMLADSD